MLHRRHAAKWNWVHLVCLSKHTILSRSTFYIPFHSAPVPPHRSLSAQPSNNDLVLCSCVHFRMAARQRSALGILREFLYLIRSRMRGNDQQRHEEQQQLHNNNDAMESHIIISTKCGNIQFLLCGCTASGKTMRAGDKTTCCGQNRTNRIPVAAVLYRYMVDDNDDVADCYMLQRSGHFSYC